MSSPMAPPAVPVTQCPICHAEVPGQAVECPRCGEAFEPLDASSEPAATRRIAGAREQFLYYAGITLVLLGGPGIALGSWLHDVLHISYLNYNSFDVFGSMNRLVLALGMIVMIVGVVLLILSLRLTGPGETDTSA